MNIHHFSENYLIALRASVEASESIMLAYSKNIEVDVKEDGSPVTGADLESSEIIYRHLQETEIPIVSEEFEIPAYHIRAQWKENWCVDPLDGTKMFILKNGEFSVNIAHIVDKKAVFGIIASPVERKIIAGGKKNGIYLIPFEHVEDDSKWEKLRPAEKTNDPLVVTCSRGFNNEKLEYVDALKNKHGKIKFIKMGSALKFFHLADNSADIYFRFAPTMEWDIAAGQAIIEALGGEVKNIESGIALSYNKENLYNPFFVAKNRALIDS